MGGGSSGNVNNSSTLVLDNLGNTYCCASFTGICEFDPGPGTYTLSSSGSSDCFVSALDNNGNFLWAKQLGGLNTDIPTSISYSPLTGDLIISGNFGGMADFDPGPATYTLSSFGNLDAFVCRLSGTGNFIWAGQVGGLGFDIAYVTLDNLDNVCLSGIFTGTADFDPGPGQYTLNPFGSGIGAFVAKLSANGNFIFAKQFARTSPASSVNGRRIISGANGEIYASGWFSGLVDFDPGPSTYTLMSSGTFDTYLVTLDNLGNFVSAKQFGGSNNTQVTGLGKDNSGNFYFTGFFLGTTDFNSDAGTYTLSSNGNSDVFIVKLSDCLDAPLNTSGFYHCAGSSVTLSASSNGNLSWYASLSAPNAIANGSVIITPSLSAATYTYYVEASTCTTSVIRTPVIFSVAPIPQLQISSNTLQLCMGHTATLAVSGADTYTWQSGIQSNSITVSPALSSQISVAGSSTLSGCKNTDSLFIAVNPLPNIQISPAQGTFCSGSSINLKASGASSYTWNSSVTASSITVSPLLSTSYTVVGTSSVGCVNIQSVNLEINACLALAEQQLVNDSFIYPNPTKDKLSIQTSVDAEIVLINNLGELILETKFLAGENSLDLSHLATGVYFMTLRSETSYQRFKVVKM